MKSLHVVRDICKLIFIEGGSYEYIGKLVKSKVTHLHIAHMRCSCLTSNINQYRYRVMYIISKL